MNREAAYASIERLRELLALVSARQESGSLRSNGGSFRLGLDQANELVGEWNEYFRSLSRTRQKKLAHSIDRLDSHDYSPNRIAMHEVLSANTHDLRDVRLVVWNRPTNRPRLAVLGSALKSNPAKQINALLAFRETVKRVPSEFEWLIHPSTAFGQVSLISTALFQKPHRVLVAPRRNEYFLDWLARIFDDLEPTTAQSVIVSPPIACYRSQSKAQSQGMVDRLLASLADDVWVVSARPGGTVESLVRSPEPIASKSSRRIKVLDAAPSQSSSRLQEVNCTASISDSKRIEEASSAFPDYETLIHWTRPQPGPWPDQSDAQYWIEMIWSAPWIERTALSSLKRIIHTKKLIGTSRLTRGPARVVSFSAVRPEDIMNRSTYRSHLRRKDFVPFGFCFRKSSLIDLGARSVTYGDDELWNRMPKRDRPYFQTAVSHNRSGRPIDWTLEQEWRLLGDLPLNQLSTDDVQVFVPSKSEADALQPDCPWEVFRIA